MRSAALALLLLVGCDRSTDATTTSPDAGDATGRTAPAHCQIDAVFPPRDGGAGGSCRAARYALMCGSSIFCISDDPARCDMLGTESSDTSPCVSQCAVDEYAAACAPPTDDGGTTQPPSTCRVTAQAPGGHPFYCCACE
jgi:hypothetical protein